MARNEKDTPVYEEPVKTEEAPIAFSAPITPEPQFTRSQLIESKKYAAYRDALAALLKDGDLYTTAEVEQQLDEFLNKEAN